MLDKNTMIKVTNRNKGTVGYTIPEMHLTRNFQMGETKEIPMSELRQLSYLPGGQIIINECLVVDNEEALRELNPNYEPEYFYTEKDVEMLLTVGSIDQFLDCLDFAPEGVINLIKDKAVTLEINDLAKRKAILEKTGFNVTKAIEINHESEMVNEEETKVRRTVPMKAGETPTVERRTSTPVSRYNVVSK
jgi:hypothetical protein